MATKLSGDSPLLIGSDAMRMQESGESQCFSHMWYFSKEEIENHSPSRRDGIDFSTESHLRKLYCSFLQDLGKTLKVPQLTIATSTIFCHQFYMRQSHAKNDWQTVAIVCLFTACKVEETPRLLRDVVVMGYEMMYKWDPSASRRIRQKEIYDKQKELILTGERLLLSTIAFDLNIQHPYKPLVKALKRLGISNCDIPKVAWNFVNDWLSTTLCLQYKPHYIAAGSLFLAAKFQRVKLPTEKGREWWLEFDLSFKHLEEVIQQMLKSLEQNKKQALSGMKMTESTTSAGKAALRNGPLVNSARCSCGKNVTLGNSISGREPLECQRSDCGSAGSTIEDADGCDTWKRTGESATDMRCKIVNVGGSRRHIRDANQIGEA